MQPTGPLDLFLAAPPGLESALLAEARALELDGCAAVAGGVRATGDWGEVWRANLHLRGAGRVLVRFAEFRAVHLAQLDKRARRLAWSSVLRADVAVRVEATSKRSRIYHAGAAAERIARAIREELGAPAQSGAKAGAGEEAVRVLVRLEDDLCTISLDTSGEPLHRRGHKLAVAKAPLRETLAALLLRQLGYDGRESVLDPMCGSGTLVLEAAEIALGLAPGRTRAFAFERLAGFEAATWQAMRSAHETAPAPPHCYGFDRDAGAIEASRANAARAGVEGYAQFARQSITDLMPPEGARPGLIVVNPPYGARIGDKGRLRALYASFGRVVAERFSGWRVGLVTSEGDLARACGLPFAPPGPPVPHGSLRIRLYRTAVLP
ncbi:MAG: class I SAM-dependent RNA methyltransferase [Pseudomonadota bacterium]